MFMYIFIYISIFMFIFKFIFISIHICICIYKQHCAYVVEGLTGSDAVLVTMQLSRLSLSSASSVGTRKGGIAMLFRRLSRHPTALFLPVYTFWRFKIWYYPSTAHPVWLLGPLSVALLHVICLFARAYVYACVHTLTLVYIYTVNLIHMHTHINKCLQLISVLQADHFFWNSAHGNASWRRAVAPLVIEYVLVDEYWSIIYNFWFFWTAARGSAPCWWAVARLVVKYLIVNE